MNSQAQHTPYFLSCDWGTSNFRLALVERSTGKIIARQQESTGIKKLYEKWSLPGVKEDRVEFFLGFLHEQISALQKHAPCALDHLPVVISGMASSSIGIRELPYRHLPVGLQKPNLEVQILDTEANFPHAVYLVSGLRSDDDVMRGEETQLLGLASKLGIPDGLYLLAGTHCKHIQVQDGSIVDFKTYMTGELFNLMAANSILADSISTTAGDNFHPDDSFDEGFRQAVRGNILHELFLIRTRDLLHKAKASDNARYLSGLLIGTEMKALDPPNPQQIVLSGTQPLVNCYRRACEILQLKFRMADADAESVTARGQQLLLEQIIHT